MTDKLQNTVLAKYRGDGTFRIRRWKEEAVLAGGQKRPSELGALSLRANPGMEDRGG